jgi:membrane-bound lytic murein transglycosylase D
MTAKSLLKPVFLISLSLLPSFSVLAETNLAGDEIIILGDYAANKGLDTSLSINPGLQVDPILSYLPEAGSSDKDDTSADNTATVSDDLWQRIKDGYAMPELQSEYTSNHESWYASRPDYVKRMVARSQKYLFHIVEEVEKRGMPTEIALLPMVESAFNPQANSRSRASGIWQFIPSTGKDFGLKQTWWVDNRRDVTAATNAALTYLQKLHVMFGTWDLALAAYNAGEGTVKRAIERNLRQGLPTDYESLSLPEETKNYVPKLQAVKNIMTHPEQYGLSIQSIPNRPYFTKVRAPQQIDAHLAAQLAEISPDEFASLNPEYNRPVLTETGSVHEILLPVGAAGTFKANLANYDKPLVSWQTYHAKRGERMESIARKFGIGLAQLRDVNDLPTRNKFVTTTSLLVPSNKNSVNQIAIATDEHSAISPSTSSEPSSKSDIRYTVKGNENLPAIAKRYGLSAKQLVALNHLKSSRLKAGQVLLVSPGTTNIAADSKPGKRLASKKNTTHYVVKRGDTLDSIARKFDVARDDLQRWNKINGSRIAPGHKLMVMRPDEA